MLQQLFWQKIANPMAWRLRRAVTDRPWLFFLLQRLSPTFLAQALVFGELERNTFLWWVEGELDSETVEENLSSLLAEISELINRSSLPWGMDRYKIVVSRLASLPHDKKGLNYQAASDSMAIREQRHCWDLTGSRWLDWKQGIGQAQLAALLEQAAPNDDEPVTVIQVALLGHSLARLMKNLRDNNQQDDLRAISLEMDYKNLQRRVLHTSLHHFRRKLMLNGCLLLTIQSQSHVEDTGLAQMRLVGFVLDSQDR